MPALSDNRLVVAIVIITSIIATILGIAGYFRVEPEQATNVFITLSGGETPTPIVVESTVIATPTFFPSATPQSTAEPIEIEVTKEVEVTRVVEMEVTKIVEVEVTKIVTVTPPPEPTATATPQITPAGTILAVGETWVHNDRALRLRRCDFSPNPSTRLVCIFEYENRSTSPVSFEIRAADLTSTTNNGLVEEPSTLRAGNSWPSYFGENAFVEQGELFILNGGTGIPFNINYFDGAITEVVFTARNIGGIPEAKWRIAIPH